MNKKSIIFIEPTGNRTNVFDKAMGLPLMGSLYLGTILHNNGYNVKILNENLLSKDVDPYEINADIYCITALTLSASRAKLLAAQLKRIHKRSMVIIGGIHASLIPEEFTDVADYVVVGEAEEIILDVIEGKYKEKIIYGTKTIDLDKLPLINYKLLECVEKMDPIPIMTSRGCPFDCNFCTVTKIFGRKFRMQSPTKIISEIENVKNYSKCNYFFFYDDNFTANRKRISELCDLLIEKKYQINFGAQVRSDLAKDPELLEKMVKAGLRRVYVGFESIDDNVLKALNKSQSRSDIELSISTFRRFGVRIHGMFIFGEDHDIVQSIYDTTKFATENGIDTVQFMILTPFPGTECFERFEKEDRLFHKDWDYYNGMFAVFQPQNISPVKLTYETYKAYKKFYSLKKVFLDSLYLIFNIFIDALVWNLERINYYNPDSILIRGIANIIVSKYSKIYSSYIKYLGNLEKEKLLKHGKNDTL